MVARHSTLTAERLRELLAYDSSTGLFVWRERSNGRVPAGTVAGSPHPTGYIQIKIARVMHKAHRLAWLYCHGVWPDRFMDIDHMNGDRGDNRIENLRVISRAGNAQNRRRANRGSRTSMLGVYYRQGRSRPWSAAIFVFGKQKHLGSYFSADEARAAYLEAKRRLHEGNLL